MRQQDINLVWVDGILSDSDANYETIDQTHRVITVPKESQLKIVETYLYTNESIKTSTNSLLEIFVEENATLDYATIQPGNTASSHISETRITQARNSNVNTFSLSLGSALMRNNLSIALAGEGANVRADGLYFVKGARQVDNHTQIDHLKPHTTSHQLYKGILKDQSHAVFNGMIIVHEGAMQSNSRQVNHNLLLSRQARIDTKPELKIFNDDVKCTHGATVGQLDDEALFYLESRGLDNNKATEILSHAFVNDVISNIRDPHVRSKVDYYMKDVFSEGSR